MRKMQCLALMLFIVTVSYSQSYNLDSSQTALKTKKDSTYQALKKHRDSIINAMMHEDSVKTEKEFEQKNKEEKWRYISTYPVFNGGNWSGVLKVDNPTEIPDPNIEYLLLFELTSVNPDSTAKEINAGLTECARVINLHVASGIPLQKIKMVMVVHAGALHAISTNEHYQKKYKTDNPNLKLLDEMKKLGMKFIACGQAMNYFEVKKEELLPDVKISVTAQTVLSAYHMKGYKLFWL